MCHKQWELKCKTKKGRGMMMMMNDCLPFNQLRCLRFYVVVLLLLKENEKEWKRCMIMNVLT